MGALGFLIPAAHRLAIDPHRASRLAALGVTSLSLLGDDEVVAVVLEGWSFDAEGQAEDVGAVLLDGRSGTRVLRVLAQMNLSRGGDHADRSPTEPSTKGGWRE